MWWFGKNKAKAGDEIFLEPLQVNCAKGRNMSEKTMPSGSNLPLCWTDDMDRFICHCDALGEYDYDDIVAALRDKFPELRDERVSDDSVERRILFLDQQDNDYFAVGSMIAVDKLHEKGVEVPAMDLEKYRKPVNELKGSNNQLGSARNKSIRMITAEAEQLPERAKEIEATRRKSRTQFWSAEEQQRLRERGSPTKSPPTRSAPRQPGKATGYRKAVGSPDSGLKTPAGPAIPDENLNPGAPLRSNAYNAAKQDYFSQSPGELGESSQNTGY